MNINTVVIIHSNNTDSISSVINDISLYLQERGVNAIPFFIPYHHPVDKTLPEDSIDLAIVVGGDGTTLRASRICAERSIPLLPVNQGNFGFINEILLDEWKEVFEECVNDQSYIGEYPLLEVKVDNHTWLSFNDITIASAQYGTIASSVYRGNERIIKYRADGIIISTPTGSTAHSLSAGGPIIVPGINALMINPIAPFSLSNRPIILSLENELRIMIEESRSPSVLVVDGRVVVGLLNHSTIIVKDSTLKSKIIHSNKRSYFEILRDKLGWAGEFRA